MLYVLANVSNCAIQYGPTTEDHPASLCTEISSTNICSKDFETYHCNDNTNPNYEVHVLGSYQALTCCSDVPETSRIEVVNEGQVGRKVVLVLASSRPVVWYLDMDDGMEIERVVLVSKGCNQSRSQSFGNKVCDNQIKLTLKALFHSNFNRKLAAARTFIQSPYLKALAASLRFGFCDEWKRGFTEHLRYRK